MKKKVLVQKLMKSVFDKAKEESGEETPYGLSKYLHHEKNLNIGERNLTRYYNFYMEGKRKESIEPDKTNLDILSRYLGYKDFKDYSDQLRNEVEKLKRRLTLSMVISGVFLSGLLFYISKYYEKNCMIWVEGHYEKVRCSGKTAQTELNMISLNRFRQITPCDTTTFFRNGNPALWYDKSNNNLTYFTYPGKHPINGKALKDITADIIDAHLSPLKNCDSIN